MHVDTIHSPLLPPITIINLEVGGLENREERTRGKISA